MQAIFQLAIFVQNNLLNYELPKIIVFSQKRQENNKLTKYSHRLTGRLHYKGRKTINLPKLMCVVYNIQRTWICCFRNLYKKKLAQMCCRFKLAQITLPTVVLLQIGPCC